MPDSPPPRRPIPFLGAVALLVLGGVIVVGIQALIQNQPRAVGGASASPAPASATLAAFHDAVARGDSGAIKQMSASVDVNAPIADETSARAGMTPLMLAASEGSLDTLRALIDARCRTEGRTPDGRTALMQAAAFGDSAKVRALLEAGAVAGARNNDGWTALMFAAARGEPASVAALISAGADINATNRWRQTALMQAARSGSLEKVAALLEAGADASLRDNFDITALLIAAESSDATPPVLEALVKSGAPVDAPDRDGVTPLMKAAESGDVEKVRALLAAGASRDAKDKANSWTARDWAGKRDDEKGREVVRVLGGQ